MMQDPAGSSVVPDTISVLVVRLTVHVKSGRACRAVSHVTDAPLVVVQ